LRPHCQWTQQLHTCGLLRGAFRPEEQIYVLRNYVPQRAMLVSSAAIHIQHMQNALDQMNIKLHHVVQEITRQPACALFTVFLGASTMPSAWRSCTMRAASMMWQK
jgi:transposase